MADPAGTTVITMPQPTANGALHVGHLAGPYLAADIAARAARAGGGRVLLCCGLDTHQNWVLLKAQQAGWEVDQMLAEFAGEIVAALGKARVEYDVFSDPREPGHEPTIAAAIEELLAADRVRLGPTDLHRCPRCERTLHHSYVAGRCPRCGGEAAGGACEGCGGFTCAASLRDPVCSQCQVPPRRFRATVPVLRMEDYRPQLAALVARVEMPARVRAILTRQLAGPLPELPVAYPTDWGIELSGPLAGLRVDPYTEVALTDATRIAGAVAPGVDYLTAWQQVDQLWNFSGLDNAFCYGLQWPAVFAALGIDPLPSTGLVTNEFFTLTGAKVSTSRNHVIWANDLLAKEDPELVRLFLAWNRPDRYASDFTWPAFEAFRDHVTPLLAGRPRRNPGDGRQHPLPDSMLAAERERGAHALRLVGFDPALATRSLLALLAAGADGEPLRSCLTGAGPA